MPQEPKKKHSKARKRTRRASIELKNVGLVECQNCKEPKLPHRICKSCGYYNSKKTVEKGKVEVIKA